jgi:ABC-type transport system involved in multi-copper enzyme maturation permease subunit
MTGTITPRGATVRAEPGGFGRLLHAEWTKFRTVRGWVIGMIVAGLLIIAVNLIPGGECGQVQSGGQVIQGAPGCALTLGPGGEAVTDSFYFVHQPMASSGSITVRVTSMTGSNSPGGAPSQEQGSAVPPWSKAGIIIKASTRPGSAYAAMMITGAHGIRMQWDYTRDTSGLAGAVSAAAPRWLRLTRSGDTITGYDSADGAHWARVGTATLAGLPAMVPSGLFAASPVSSDVTSQSVSGSSASGLSTQATAAFDHVSPHGTPPGSRWSGTDIGGGPSAANQAQGVGYRQSGGALIVTGSGDIAPELPGGDGGTAGSVAGTLVGTFAGLIAVLVVATMFITAEFRRGLIRVTLTASPRRNRVLAAKAVVLAAVTFAVGLPAACIALLIGERKLHSGGISVYPVPALTELRMIAGTAALLAVAAVLALGIGAVLRRSAAAVTAVIAVIVLPYFFAGPLAVLPAGAADWLLRVTPAAGFAIQAGYPRYPQLDYSYTPANGYFPLAPWAGFAVLCMWAALALGLAGFLLRRRDA